MAIGMLDDLRIVGGHPALDLANTMAPRPPAAVELEFLPDPATMLRWAGLAGVIDEQEAQRIEHSWEQAAGTAEAALADVCALRDLIAPALAGHQLEKLTVRWRSAIGRSTLVEPGKAAGGGRDGQEGGSGSAVLEIGNEPTSMIGDRLADAIVDLVRHVDLNRLRVCPLAEGGCGWLFLDRSRNSSRRWCSMDDCGTHAKSRRLTERRRARR